MKIFLSSVFAAVLIAGVASVVLTRVVQENAKTAFTASSARP